MLFDIKTTFAVQKYFINWNIFKQTFLKIQVTLISKYLHCHRLPQCLEFRTVYYLLPSSYSIVHERFYSFKKQTISWASHSYDSTLIWKLGGRYVRPIPCELNGRRTETSTQCAQIWNNLHLVKYVFCGQSLYECMI